MELQKLKAKKLDQLEKKEKVLEKMLAQVNWGSPVNLLQGKTKKEKASPTLLSLPE